MRNHGAKRWGSYLVDNLSRDQRREDISARSSFSYGMLVSVELLCFDEPMRGSFLFMLLLLQESKCFPQQNHMLLAPPY
jgi:hypothetical protein